MTTTLEPTALDAANSVTLRLTRELKALGHAVGFRADATRNSEGCVILVDSAEWLDVRVTADCDSSGRLARVRVGYEAASGRRVRWGGPGEVETFADMKELAAQISEEAKR